MATKNESKNKFSKIKHISHTFRLLLIQKLKHYYFRNHPTKILILCFNGSIIKLFINRLYSVLLLQHTLRVCAGASETESLSKYVFEQSKGKIIT